MTGFRVTVAANTARSVAGIEAAAARAAKLQDEVSSGRRIQTPSDDPAGTVTALQLRGQAARNTRYAANSSDALAWLSTADGTYSQVVSALQSARTLVVQGLNTGANDATSRDAIASQLDGLRNTLLSLANTQYNGRPIFGGTTAGTAAFDSSGAYLGDSGSVTRAIAPGTTVAVNASGTDVFGDQAAGTSVFDLLQTLSGALRSDPPTLTGSALTDLDSALSRVSTAQATEGGVYQQVQDAQSTQTTVGTSIKTQLSGIEEVDMADAAVRLAAANSSYQAALQTTASIGQLSLLDFLR
jgi:flagellar hook-associated protein 3 FlgL